MHTCAHISNGFFSSDYAEKTIYELLYAKIFQYFLANPQSVGGLKSANSLKKFDNFLFDDPEI